MKDELAFQSHNVCQYSNYFIFVQTSKWSCFIRTENKGFLNGLSVGSRCCPVGSVIRPPQLRFRFPLFSKRRWLKILKEKLFEITFSSFISFCRFWKFGRSLNLGFVGGEGTSADIIHISLHVNVVWHIRFFQRSH